MIQIQLKYSATSQLKCQDISQGHANHYELHYVVTER